MWQRWKPGGRTEAIRLSGLEMIMGPDRLGSPMRYSNISPSLRKTEAQVLLGGWMGGRLFLLFGETMKMSVLLKQGNKLWAILIKLHKCI